MNLKRNDRNDLYVRYFYIFRTVRFNQNNNDKNLVAHQPIIDIFEYKCMNQNLLIQFQIV